MAGSIPTAQEASCVWVSAGMVRGTQSDMPRTCSSQLRVPLPHLLLRAVNTEPCETTLAWRECPGLPWGSFLPLPHGALQTPGGQPGHWWWGQGKSPLLRNKAVPRCSGKCPTWSLGLRSKGRKWTRPAQSIEWETWSHLRHSLYRGRGPGRDPTVGVERGQSSMVSGLS